MTGPEIFDLVRDRRLAVIASVASSGGPEAAIVGIAVTDEHEIIFDTLKNTRKYANLKADPRCALVVEGDEEITIQIEGVVFEPSGECLAHYQEIYFRVHPDGRDRSQWPGIACLVVRPTWIRYSDFRTKPERIVEISMA
jgi:hypothetical protein